MLARWLYGAALEQVLGIMPRRGWPFAGALPSPLGQKYQGCSVDFLFGAAQADTMMTRLSSVPTWRSLVYHNTQPKE